MTRWHDSWCYKPDIKVREGIPHCRNCNRSPDINTLVKNATAPNPFSQAPEDEPLGELNLYWPSSVTYSGPTGTDRSKPVRKGRREPKPSQVYPTRLGTDEFRLLRLHPSNDVDDPVWAELESYPLQRCPEYEATSYTWACEDGDSSLSRPIFIGPYWDLQLQTRNCWSMLQAMRLPGRESRMVWIDAICINQDDIEERDSQVSKMTEIYTGCRRVYLYLGPDITTPFGNQHPFRRELTAYSTKQAEAARLDGFDLLNILDLLHRRYFTRVWVVQELVLARQVVIQTRDAEFWMAASTVRSLALREVKTARWIQHIAQRQSQHRNVYEALRETRNSCCGDVRDKVFGLLALCVKDNTSQVLQPNYELSCVQTFVGVFSHIVLNLKQTDVLLHASGQSAWNRYPSWVPDWMASGPEWLFQYPEHDAMESIEKLAHESPNFMFCPVTLDLLERTRSIIKVKTSGWDKRISPSHSVWHQEATINAATGTMSTSLVHILRFRSAPYPVASSRGLIIFAWQEKTTTMFLASNSRLKIQIMAGDHLFVLYTERRSCIYFIMREFDTPSNTFRLLACGNDLGFNIPFESTSPETLEFQEPPSLELHPADLQSSLFHDLESFRLKTYIYRDVGKLKALFLWPERLVQLKRSQDFRDLWASISLDKSLPGHRGSLLEKRSDSATGFDSTREPQGASNAKTAQDASNLLPALQGILNEARGLAPGFLESYVGCLSDSILPREQEDHVIIYLTSPLFAKGSVYEFETESAQPQGSMFQYRASKSKLRRVIRDTWTFQFLAGFTPAARLTGESEIDIVGRGPRDEDRSVFYSRWPTEIMEHFQIDGKTQQVNIA